MDEDITPPTEPSGRLVPPPKVPPTAVAAATPGPVPEPDEASHIRWRPGSPVYIAVEIPGLQRLITRTLDVVDELADAVASGLGLRNE
jgi:hypothetical protein